jgi:serine/threonine protein kinase
VPEFLSREAKKIIQSLLEVNTKKRITAKELVKEPWITCKDLLLSEIDTANISISNRNNSCDNRKRDNRS